MRILIVEDEVEMARLVGWKLGKAGFSYDQAQSLDLAFEALKQYPYDLVLLDRRLPDGDAAEALPMIRELRPGIRILMLTALEAPEERIKGLDAGADDYLTKPFDSGELMARVRARLRQPGSAPAPPIMLGALKFDLHAQNAWIADRPLTLPKREFALLEALARRANRVASRASLLEDVYGFDEAVQPGALDTLVSRLRKRLDEGQAGVTIHLVRGRGYLLTETED
jgi:two-component system, OmpR family, response regulator